uniref:Uncharacterized protein n=1 Tax=Coccolithus braarudii TaxID=221442 RepID=A0A7S0LHY8_9EUKA
MRASHVDGVSGPLTMLWWLEVHFSELGSSGDTPMADSAGARRPLLCWMGVRWSDASKASLTSDEVREWGRRRAQFPLLIFRVCSGEMMTDSRNEIDSDLARVCTLDPSSSRHAFSSRKAFA